ncbi:MAG: flagellar hook-basal body protein [Planctomycetota bacterium]|nr:flagellar hook-basal body protein [Planctomycetota bacterium]
MLYGLHLSTQGAQNQLTRLDVLANNLANASTNGFKRDFAVFQAHQSYDRTYGGQEKPPGNLNESTGGTSTATVRTDFSTGAATQTGSPFDLAIQGDGFLRVSDGQAEFLTRNGRLTVNADGELVQQDTGHRVLSSSGTSLEIPDNAGEIEISTAGGLYQLIDGERVLLGQFDVVRPTSVDALEKRPDGLFTFQGSLQSAVETSTLRQGFVEASGVKPIEELMDLIEASRVVETNVNMMKMQDEMLGQLLQSAMR